MIDSHRWIWMAAALVLGGLIYLLAPILSPFLIGILLAYMGDPLVDRLERHKLSRTWGVVVVFALITLMLIILLLVLLPMLGKQLVHLYEMVPQILDWLQTRALPWIQLQFGLNDGFWHFDQLKAAFSGQMGKTTDFVGSLLSTATASGLALLAWLANLLLIPVAVSYTHLTLPTKRIV